MCRLCCPLEASAFAAEVFLDGEQVGSTAIPHLCGKARWPPTRPGFQWGFPHGFHCEALFPTVTFQNVTLLGLSSWRMLVIHVSEKLEVQPYFLRHKKDGSNISLLSCWEMIPCSCFFICKSFSCEQLVSRSFRNCCGPVERWWNPASILAY